MIVGNLFAGPGAGKSTLAAATFAELKLRGRNVELVTEYAKDLTWEGRHSTLSNQVYVFGKQLHRMERLRGKVEAVITDSPLILSLIYKPNDYPLSFDQLVLDMNDRFENVNFFVERCKAYNPAGRNQTESEAKQIDGEVRDFLDTKGIDYTPLPGHWEAVPWIADEIERRL